MKKLVAGIAVVGLLAGMASAEWRVYRQTSQQKSLGSWYGYIESSDYGTNPPGQLATFDWNASVVTNPEYKVWGARDAAGNLIVEANTRAQVSKWYSLVVVNVKADGQATVWSNNLVTAYPKQTYKWENGDVNTNIPVIPAGTETNMGTYTAARIDLNSARGYKTGERARKLIRWFDVYPSDPWWNAERSLDGYQTWPLGQEAARKPAKGFPKSFNERYTYTWMNYDWDNYKGVPVPTSVDLGSAYSTRFDAALSRAASTATDLNGAVAKVLAELAKQKYMPVSEVITQDSDFVFDSWDDPTFTYPDEYQAWIDDGKGEDINVDVQTYSQTLVDGYIVGY